MQFDLFSAIFPTSALNLCQFFKEVTKPPNTSITMNFRKSKKKIIYWTSQREELEINVEFIFHVIEG